MQISLHEWDDSAHSPGRTASPGHDELQVWTAQVPQDASDLARLSRILSPDERERADLFRASGPRGEFITGRARLRQLLGTCLDLEPSNLVFGYQPRGKPFLARPEPGGDIRFNLSHSGGLILIALTCGREVGVDLESIHGLDDWMPAARRIFSPQAYRELESLPRNQQQEAFSRGWTRKEAYLKATGEGLVDALAAIEVTLAPGKEPELLNLPTGPGTARLWSLRDIPLPSGFIGAAAFPKTCIGHNLT